MHKIRIYTAIGLMLLWGYVRNSYFGWNALPESDTELLTDGISVIGWLMIILYKE